MGPTWDQEGGLPCSFIIYIRMDSLGGSRLKLVLTAAAVAAELWLEMVPVPSRSCIWNGGQEGRYWLNSLYP